MAGTILIALREAQQFPVAQQLAVPFTPLAVDVDEQEREIKELEELAEEFSDEDEVLSAVCVCPSAFIQHRRLVVLLLFCSLSCFQHVMASELQKLKLCLCLVIGGCTTAGQRCGRNKGRR